MVSLCYLSNLNDFLVFMSFGVEDDCYVCLIWVVKNEWEMIYGILNVFCLGLCIMGKIFLIMFVLEKDVFFGMNFFFKYNFICLLCS